MKLKRLNRRRKREKELGPERHVVSLTSEKAELCCGHIILNPPIQNTVRMLQPKFYRCVECQKVCVP